MASRARQLSKLLSSDLLTVDVNNNRIGVNSTAPEETLDVRDSLTVGFDTSATSRDLHVYSDLAAPVRIETTNTRSVIDFKDSNTTADYNVELGSRGDNLYLEGREAIELITNGTNERMRITSDGRIGIGTTNPATSDDLEAFFQVSPSISGISTRPGVESISVLNNGQVAIGRSTLIPGAVGFQTVTPTMTRGGSNVSIYVGNDDSDRLSRVMGGVPAYTAQYGELLIEGTKPGVASSADQTWGIRFHQGNGSGAASGRCSAAIHAIRSNDNNGSTDLAFKTRSGNSNNAERMVITSNGLVQFNSGIGSARYTAYGVRAWANFNGSGTLSIRASGNCSSIADNGTGNYSFNFINPMPDNDYVFTGSTARNATPAFTGSGAIMSTTAFRINVGNDDGNGSFSAAVVDTIMVIGIR